MLTARPTRIVVDRIDARARRDSILELFRNNGKPEFERTFDWHYSASACPSRCWCLRNPHSGKLAGFVSVLERHFRMGGTHISAGVSADLLIAESARSLGSALTLIRATHEEVIEGRCDVLLARGNENSSRLIDRLGYVSLGTWQSHHCFNRSRAKLRRKWGLPGAAASPIVDAWSKVTRGRRRPDPELELKLLDPGQVPGIDTRDWRRRSCISVDYPPEELVWRYHEDPRTPTDLWALRSTDGTIRAIFAVSEPRSGELFIRDLQADQRHLSDHQAIRLAVDQLDCDSITLQLLNQSPLASKLSAFGFLHIPAAGRPVMGYWRPDHPLADSFADATQWCLLPGYYDI